MKKLKNFADYEKNKKNSETSIIHKIFWYKVYFKLFQSILQLLTDLGPGKIDYGILLSFTAKQGSLSQDFVIFL